MAIQRETSRTRKKNRVSRVRPLRDLSPDSVASFVADLNREMAFMSERFADIPSLPVDLDLGDYLRKNEFEDALDDIEERDASLLTSEGEDIGDAASARGRRGRRTSRRRRQLETSITAAVSGALPTAAPPEIETASAIGTTTSPAKFALQDHTHSGMNLSDVQTAAGLKTFSAGLDVGPASEFTVSVAGDLTTINSVPYTWPGANAAGVLTNDAAGNLSWSTTPGLDHGSLTGLVPDDDHTQYLLLAGRAAGTNNPVLSTTADGALAGSSASTFDLILLSNITNDGKIILGASVTGTDSVVVHGTEAGITIGGVAFETRLVIHDQAALAHIGLGIHKHTNTSAVGPSVEFARSRGTEAAETVVADNDVIARIVGLGHDGTDYERVALIQMEVDDPTPSGTSMGGAITLSTTPVTTTSLVERLRVSEAGRVSVAGSGFSVNGKDYVWPAGGGAVGTVLINNGSDVLTWGIVADSISVNGTPVTDADFDDTTPAPPAGDLNVLWQTSGTGPADISAYVDVSALEPLLTLGNLAGTLDHNADLTNLAVGDVHTHYTLLAGRAGGQDLHGGTATGDDLELNANNNVFAWANAGRILPHERILFNESFTYNPSTLDAWMRIEGTHTTTAAGGVGQPTVVHSKRTIRYAIRSVFAVAPTMWANDVFQPTAALVDAASSYSGFYSNPFFTPDIGSGTALTPLLVGFWGDPRTDLANLGNGTVTEMVAFRAFNNQTITLDANSTVTSLYGFHMKNAPAGTGTITTEAAINIDDLTGGATNLSLRSLGAAVEMRHAGPAVFAANAAPTNASTGLEVQSTTKAFLASRMTTTQRNALTPVVGMVIYNTTTGDLEGYTTTGGPGWVTL